MNRKFSLLFSVVVLLVVGLACGSSNLPTPSAEPTNASTATPRPTRVPTWTPTPSVSPIPVNTATPEPPAATSDDLALDPNGGELSSLIDAAPDCAPISVTWTATINLFGIMTTATNFYEIRGMEADACVLYMRLEEEHIAFTEELAQMSLDAGATPEELEKVLEEANTAADSLEGRDGVCRFSNTEDLIVSLTDLQEGNWSASSSCSLGAEGAECETTGTFSNADCEGDLFSGTLE